MSATGKPVTLMTDDELQRAADAIARSIAHGTALPGDSFVVMELAIRLARYTPVRKVADTKATGEQR